MSFFGQGSTGLQLPPDVTTKQVLALNLVIRYLLQHHLLIRLVHLHTCPPSPRQSEDLLYRSLEPLGIISQSEPPPEPLRALRISRQSGAPTSSSFPPSASSSSPQSLPLALHISSLGSRTIPRASDWFPPRYPSSLQAELPEPHLPIHPRATTSAPRAVATGRLRAAVTRRATEAPRPQGSQAEGCDNGRQH